MKKWGENLIPYLHPSLIILGKRVSEAGQSKDGALIIN